MKKREMGHQKEEEEEAGTCDQTSWWKNCLKAEGTWEGTKLLYLLRGRGVERGARGLMKGW